MSSERPTVSLGFTTEQFPVGVHVCQIYQDEQERQDSLLRFLLAGMQAGECARCISDRTSEAELSDFLAAHGISLAAARASGAMGLAPARATYLGEGRFDPERTLGELCRYHEDAVRQGFPSARVIGEMSPDVLHAPGGSRLLEYEARVSILLREHPVTAVCQYDAGAFSGATLMDVLTVHPLMVVRGSVVHNPFFIPPGAVPRDQGRKGIAAMRSPGVADLEAPVLGKLSLMQSMLGSLPDEVSIFSFVCRGLEDLPGAAGVRHVLADTEPAAQTEARFPLSVGSSSWGELRIRVTAPAAFSRYEPYLRNFCFMLAVLLDERRQRQLNDEYRRQLERRVEERTARLTAEIAERTLMEEERTRLAMAVEQAAESIIITKTDGTILYVNPAFERTSGYCRQEILGKNPRVLKSGKQDAAFYRDMWKVLQSGRVWQGQFCNRRKDGGLYEEDATISPIRDAGDRIVNYVAVKRDVTRERVLEGQLRQAQKMEVVGRLAGGIAHDFNNLLTVILGFNELAQAALPPDTPVGSLLEQVKTAGERAAALTRQLLAFGRKQALLQQVIDLAELVGHLVQMLQRLVGEDIHLVTEFETGLGRVKADRSQIEQVIVNLAVNARDAMPTGGTLILGATNVELKTAPAGSPPGLRPGRYVRLTVKDTGTGLSPAAQQHLFEPFFTTKEQGKGTGLGLATVHGVIQQSGGHIEVESEPGRGTTFKIFLPHVDAASDPVAAGPVRAGQTRGHETVLLVEDEEQLRDLTRRMLELCGYSVLVAGNGVEALQLVRHHGGKIQLLLTDVVMPEMGGLVLAPLVSSEIPKVKVLYMSGHTDPEHFRRIQDAPGSALLRKPFSLEDLAQGVRKLLDAQ